MSTRNPSVIYLVWAPTAGRFYVGKHVTPNAFEWPRRGTGPLPDGYLGSGTVWRRVVKKYGRDGLRWIILARCESEAEAYRLERDVYRPRLWRRYGLRLANLAEGGDGLTREEGKRYGKLGGAAAAAWTAANPEKAKENGNLVHELGLGIHAQTAEERREYGKRAHELGLGIYGLTAEERRESARKGAAAANAAMTPEQLRERGRKITASMTPEQRRERGLKAGAIRATSWTREQWQELSRKAHLAIARKRHAAGQPLTPKQQALLDAFVDAA